jgi:polyribonucleotide nucleotidyltransferase
MKKSFKIDFGGKPIEIEQGLAPQANAALKLTYGDTVVLVTAVMDNRTREGANFLPLMVEYEEKLYAAGRIKGSRFMKREGRASEEAVLTGRAIDRIIRPRFDQRIRNNIQVVITVLSFDDINDPDILAVIGASLVLSISDIPWAGPLSVIRVIKLKDKFLLNPNYEQRNKSDLELTIASDGELINMIECEAKDAKNEDILAAIHFTKDELKKNINAQKQIIQKIGQKKKSLNIFELDEKEIEKADKFLKKALSSTIDPKNKFELNNLFCTIKQDLFLLFEKELQLSKNSSVFQDGLEMYFEEVVDKMVHQNILKKEQRPDGRKLDEVRELDCEVGILPRTHGSGIFKRGLTHVLSTITLGSPREEQLLDGMEIKGNKGFIHHYNFPPFSVGETGFFRGPGRREIGHGALAEKALKTIIPNRDDFPYTIRVVSEVLSSNGSSSMASACGSTLALLDAGVPIRDSVAGIAMGLMMEKNKKDYKILTDIQGPEDHYGDMDLKVAGTKNGVTAMQMDVKVEGVSEKILEEALNQAQKARKQILKKMSSIIDRHREKLSPYAPKITVINVAKEKIGDIIGGGGKTINSIIEGTGALIDIQDDGKVYISGKVKENVDKAVSIIKQIVKEYKVGEKVKGTVSRILDFGAFVTLSPKHEGLIHISKLAPYHVEKVKDVVQEGDEVNVEIIEIDDLRRINLKLVENFSRKPEKSMASFSPEPWKTKKNYYQKRP